jgi:hypothetical protein
MTARTRRTTERAVKEYAITERERGADQRAARGLTHPLHACNRPTLVGQKRCAALVDPCREGSMRRTMAQWPV